MLFKLALKNIKKSVKDYTIYFFTLVVGVIVFYVFNALDSQTAMLSVSESTREIINMLNMFLNGVSAFVAIILGGLIIYAGNFLIKRRKKEFGVYLTLGMSKRRMSMILLTETIIIGILSIRIGNAFISPSANPIINWIPASIIKSMLSISVSTISRTASTICGINVGKACAIPCINETITCIPACRI